MSEQTQTPAPTPKTRKPRVEVVSAPETPAADGVPEGYMPTVRPGIYVRSL
jgi:hypothetical protein